MHACALLQLIYNLLIMVCYLAPLLGALVLALQVSAGTLLSDSQMAFSAAADMPTSKGFETFVKHFSAPSTQSDVVLATKLRAQHPNASFLTTQSRTFGIFAYAADPEHRLRITPIRELGEFGKRVYVPVGRRRDGAGSVGEMASWKAYSIDWDGREILAYLAAWDQGYQTVQQWHLVTNEPSLLPVATLRGGSEQAGLASYSLADDLLLAVSEFTVSLKEAVLVFDQSQWMPDHKLWESVQKASWEDVILDANLKTALQKEYKSFFASEETYKELGVPWKRGVIFLGPPGNGKTISLKAIMKQATVPTLYVKTFHTYGGDEVGIRMIFERARKEAPCILVLEDLDSLITDNNRSFFLNEVDGLEDNDGLLLIGTTNYFDKLDPALSNRPSRFDRKYTFPNPTQAERKLYAAYWQRKLKNKDKIDFPDSLVDQVADRTQAFSFAYLKEAFVAALITLADDETDSPPRFGQLLLEQIKWLRHQLDQGNGDRGIMVRRVAPNQGVCLQYGIRRSGPVPS